MTSDQVAQSARDLMAVYDREAPIVEPVDDDPDPLRAMLRGMYIRHRAGVVDPRHWERQAKAYIESAKAATPELPAQLHTPDDFEPVDLADAIRTLHRIWKPVLEAIR